MRRVATGVCAACLALLPALGGAVSSGTQAGAFLLIPHGARATAMGEAFTGLADDITAVSWNPAGLAQISSFQSELSYAAWFAETAYGVVSVGGPIAPGHFLAGSIYYFHVPRIANVPEDVEAPVDLSNYAGGLSYAFQLTRRWSLGAGLKLMSQDLNQIGTPKTAAAGAMIDLGVMYRREDPPVTGGFVLQNMGPNLEFRDSDSPGPFWARLGGAWRAYEDEWLRVIGTMDISQPIDTGYKIIWPEGGIADIFNTKIVTPSYDRYNLGFGTEWWIAEILALRAGYTVRFGSDINSLSAGAGLRFTVEPFQYSVDYAISSWGDLAAAISRVSFKISLLPRIREPGW